jgi:hypothetical protein
MHRHSVIWGWVSIIAICGYYAKIDLPTKSPNQILDAPDWPAALVPGDVAVNED